MRGLAVLILAVVGCTSSADRGSEPTDTPSPTDVATDAAPTGDTAAHTGAAHTGTPGTDGGFCAVRRVFNSSCVVCHSAANAQGGLDLQTEPWAAVVGVTSPEHGVVLVAPGDPAGSLLWRKMDGSQGPTEGSFMPTTGTLPAKAAIVADWIASGATEECGTPGTTTEPEPYHPKGWGAAGIHGLAAKLQTESDCRTCHGSDLSGGSSQVSCSGCHTPGWETSCTYCHGGVSSTTGAPPEDIDDNADPATISFVPHEAHGSGRIASPIACEACHANPADALTPGHLFDDPTPAIAEVLLAAPGVYDPSTATCSQQACHGDGQGANGTVAADDGPRTCHDCHPDATSGPRAWLRMSGRHYIHIPAGLQCGECHPSAEGNGRIDQPALHVNAAIDVELPRTMRFDPVLKQCAGVCHGETHDRRTW